jgi:transcriptional regulator with XRE-family HTH domain
MAKHDESTQKELSKIGNRIKELRISSGFSSYEKFAFKNDIDRSQFGRYEKGEDMRLSSFIKVLTALGVSWKEFFDGMDERGDEGENE